ncbi:MAG: hypothetical protein Q7V19_01745 [Bacteroidales bacterium]|jgi:nucleoside-specific outer membrane channel protein Tsx|nr:hypothetical protein [Bacteroidales bacterium]MDP2237265.1 hypothetical protein [Bacteroidales bacterium]
MKRLFTILLFIQISLFVAAQEPETITTNGFPTRMISFVPQYAFMNGLRLDYDFQLTKNNWIQLAPTFYAGRENMDINNFENITGIGLHAYHRYHPGEGFGKVPVYLSFGPVYQYFHLKHNEWEMNSTKLRNTYIHRIGLDVIIGVFSPAINDIVFDVYTGIGLRHAFQTTDATKAQNFNDSFVDFGYSGSIFILGLRIGIPLN